MTEPATPGNSACPFIKQLKLNNMKNLFFAKRTALIIAGLLSVVTSCTFTSRYVFLNVPDVYDYRYLPSRTIKTDSTDSFDFIKMAESPARPVVPFNFNNAQITDLDSFLKESGTTAFIVIRNDTILYENYFNGHNHEAYCKSFSASKVFISAMIGIAVKEGLIQSLNEPVMKYIPEIKDKRFAALTIGHCLALTSGIKTNNKQVFPWHDKVRIYYTRDIRELVSQIHFSKNPGEEFYAEEFSPLILAMILERVSGKSVSAYLEENIWKPLGMESDAIWVTDRKNDGFEAANSGLTARAIDFARFGSMYLKMGNWNGQNIIPSDWVKKTTIADTTNLSFYRKIDHYEGRDVYFNSMWWGLRNNNKDSEYAASGHFGQRIYISPEKNTVVVRFGSKDANVDWTGFIMKLVEKL
jgi:hypothetical protein